MSQSYRLRRRYLVGFVVLIVVAAGWVSDRTLSEIVAGFRSALRRPTGFAQLVSYESLPPGALDDGEDCELVPVSAGTALAAAAEAQGIPAAGNGTNSSEDGGRAAIAQRKPMRMIRDSYPAFASVAVDAVNNEVVLTDENLFNVLVYDRLADTPAAITPPKRKLGGLKTIIEFQSGVYVDPKNGEIYAVNNDTVDRLVIFSRQAEGDVRPDRQVHTPHGTFAIAVDEQRQEMILTVQHDSAVVTFAKNAKPDDSPIRLLQGDQTQLADPHGIAYDPKNDLIFVTNHGSVHRVSSEATATQRSLGRRGNKSNWPLGFNNAVLGSGRILPPSITVYGRTASGDSAPLRVIQGPKTQLNWPTGLAFDPRGNEIYVANDMGDSILVFDASANGDVAPIRALKGPKTLLKNPTGVFVDTKNDELWVANFGNHSATAYKLPIAGDRAPLRVIRSAPAEQPALSIGNPHPVAYDTKREQILVPN